LYPGISLEWWFEAQIERELTGSDNEGIRKAWFKKQVIPSPFGWTIILLELSCFPELYVDKRGDRG
jgi:hypothetical protein